MYIFEFLFLSTILRGLPDMLKYIWYLIVMVFLLSLGSCSEKEIQIPAEVISQDSMVMILVDIQLTESLLTHNYNHKDSLKKYKIVYFEALFSKYNVAESEFNKSYRFYQEHIELLEKIHDDIIVELSKRQTEI